MTIKSKQLSKIVTHYIANRNQTKLHQSTLEKLIESFNTGEEVSGIFIEDYGSLGKGYYITNFGAYVVNDTESVLFLKDI